MRKRDWTASDFDITPALKDGGQARTNHLLHIRHILRLILLTGQRPGEVMGAILNELALEQRLWTIPGSRTKNGLASIVPLSPLAVREFEKQKAILENQKQKREKRGDPAPDSKFVFPNCLISKHADSSIVYIR
jgi:integrase